MLSSWERKGAAQAKLWTFTLLGFCLLLSCPASEDAELRKLWKRMASKYDLTNCHMPVVDDTLWPPSSDKMRIAILVSGRAERKALGLAMQMLRQNVLEPVSAHPALSVHVFVHLEPTNNSFLVKDVLSELTASLSPHIPKQRVIIPAGVLREVIGTQSDDEAEVDEMRVESSSFSLQHTHTYTHTHTHTHTG